MADIEFGPAVGAAGAERIEDFTKSLPSSYSHHLDQNQVADESPFDRSSFGGALDREVSQAEDQDEDREDRRRSARPARRYRPQPLDLNDDEEAALITRWQRDRHARSRDDLMRSLEPRCRAFATKYRRPELFDDLVQQAQIGAARAIDTFTPDRGARLATWAHYHMKDSVNRWLRREDTARRRVIELDKEYKDEKTGKVFTLAERLTLVDGEVVYVEGGPPVSATPPTPDDVAADSASALSKLDPRECDIVERYDIRQQTFAEIGGDLLISGERARQIHNHAISKLRTLANDGKLTRRRGKYLKSCADLDYVRRHLKPSAELNDLISHPQYGVERHLKELAYLRWKETRPTVDDVAARAPVASACEECGKAFKAVGRGKFCAAECRLKDLHRMVLRVVVRQLDRRATSATGDGRWAETRPTIKRGRGGVVGKGGAARGQSPGRIQSWRAADSRGRAFCDDRRAS